MSDITEEPGGSAQTNTLDKACYENPLFEEDGTVIGDTQTKIHGQPDGLRTKPYEISAAQTSVHFNQSTPTKRKGLYILGAIVAVIAVTAISVAVIIGQRDGPSPSSKPDPVLFLTRRVDGHLRIYKGPFSTYNPEYSDKSSVPFSLFVSSFTYQMKSIFASSDLISSFSHTEIVNISSGSVIVNFILHFYQDVEITYKSQEDITSIIIQGMSDSIFTVDSQSVILQPLDPALSVITTSRPGVCLPLSLTSCANFTSWSYTTFPNLLGHRRPSEVMEAENTFQDLMYTSCGRDFWCAVFNPKCHHSRALPPCRSYCQSVFVSCGHLYETNITSLLDCTVLPNSEDPEVCLQDPYKPGTCHENNEELCQGFGLDNVSFPNFAGHRNPYQASEMVQLFAGINHATHCYKHSMLFACTAMMPKCSMSGRIPTHVIPPCKSLCNDFKSRCEIFMDIFWTPWPHQLFCDSFPDSNDTNICFGYNEAHEPPKINECPVGQDRCDNTTCVPLKWRCDDYQDCKDGSDEMPLQTTLPLARCAVCPTGMFRCSPKSTLCVENSKRCDGIEDCPTASDEMECVKLGDGGRMGKLTIYNPSSTKWDPVCADSWNEKYTTAVCVQLHYESAVSTETVTLQVSSYFDVIQPNDNSSSEYIQSILATSNDVCAGNRFVSITCGIPVCGIRPAYIPPLLRIVGGDLADPDSLPWQVSVYGGSDFKYFCGGSIIDERWILTAGHCVGGRQDPSDILFRLGQPRRNTYSRYLQEVHPQRIYLHPAYNPSTVDNDIALIYLNETIHFNDHVRPICLPKTKERLPVGTRCLAVGWGKRNETALDYERQLKQVYLEVVDQAQCRASILSAERKVPYILNEHMFCAGGGLGHDACSGDSGGPLLCSLDQVKDSWFTAGIVSWGVGCAYPNVPGVYTNVPGYKDWIYNITKLPYL